jgi:hypothetical protein
VQTPTYKQFRTFALSQGWTPKDLAPFTQADQPEKAAERILYHLDGVVSSQTDFSWDDCPLPYPILCEVYERRTLDRGLLKIENQDPTCPCGRPLPDRKDARFCSDRCRLNAWRKRF